MALIASDAVFHIEEEGMLAMEENRQMFRIGSGKAKEKSCNAVVNYVSIRLAMLLAIYESIDIAVAASKSINGVLYHVFHARFNTR